MQVIVIGTSESRGLKTAITIHQKELEYYIYIYITLIAFVFPFFVWIPVG
jgi:hypothetical protein